MTASPPPTPGGSGPPPDGGQPGSPGPGPAQPPPPPPAQRPYGQPQYGQPQYGQPQYGQPAYGPPPDGPAGGADGAPAGTGGGVAFDAKKLRIAEYVVVGGMILFLIMAFLPWVDVAHYLGIDLPGVDTTVNGFQFSGLVTFAFVLFLLAAAWAVLPAFTEVAVGFPRGWITVGPGVLGFVLTLVAWIRSLTYGFEIWPLIALLAAAAVAVFALLRLLPDLHDRPELPGKLAGAAQWANQQAPAFPGQGRPGAAPRQATPPPPPPPYGQAAPPYGQPAPPYGQPAPPYGQPAPPYGQPAPPYGQPAPPSEQPSPYAAPPGGIPGHASPEPGILGHDVPGVAERPGTPPPEPPPGGGSTAAR